MFCIFCVPFFQYNDNNGNIYSDVYWLSAMVQAIGELEFGQQVCMDAYYLWPIFIVRCIPTNQFMLGGNKMIWYD
jgi:hypothetical protein